MDTLIQYVQRILSWLLQFVDWVLVEVVQVTLGALAAVLALIPVPSWMANAATSIQTLPPGVLYFAQACDLGFGLSVILSAYVIRFGIRRLPIVG